MGARGGRRSQTIEPQKAEEVSEGRMGEGRRIRGASFRGLKMDWGEEAPRSEDDLLLTINFAEKIVQTGQSSKM